MDSKKRTQWIDIKNAAIKYGKIPNIEYALKNGVYQIWLETGMGNLTCSVKENSVEGQDFANNYKNLVVPRYDIYGKPYVRGFSADQSNDTICFTVDGDDYENQIIGSGLSIAWDASETTGPLAFDSDTIKTIDINFIDPVRIFGGVLYWENGDMSCTGDCMIVCPEGHLLQMVNDQPYYAPADYIINWYSRSIPMMGNCNIGSPQHPEGASESVPTNLGWVVRIIIKKKATNTTFRGKIALVIYRKSNV